ncbi:hypothetical protein B0H21DRAFT_822635 [Amylocystis lapponica]|nr:hypothetical protein B0H21DRAFT_822635 [Amylocystis lapponica]
MKPIHKRLYSALPRPHPPSSSSSPVSRVRSNSISRTLYTVNPSSLPLSFFDAPPPPPPSSRPAHAHTIIPTRLAAEVKAEVDSQPNSPYSGNHGQNTPQSHQPAGPPPYSLALSAGQSESSSHIPSSYYSPFFPYSLFVPTSCYSPNSPPVSDTQPGEQHTRYHLDVGAYGIPKRSHGTCVAGRDGNGKLGLGAASHGHGEQLNRAVQVGEDAFFVRDNAMGVADGVGGWSRMHRTSKHNDSEPSPSALFARRLMHFCSEEVEAATSAFEELDSSVEETSADTSDLCSELEDSLEDLEDGLDVLMILEKAYEKTMQAHVVEQDSEEAVRIDARASIPTGSSDARGLAAQPSDKRHLTTHSSVSSNTSALPNASVDVLSAKTCLSVPRPLNASHQERSIPRPRLAQGSSTALFAILEHPSVRLRKPSPVSPPSFSPLPPHTSKYPTASDRGAVIRIAHLGDCMGMLIRGEQIVWRTEEMWWSFNTPVQLGPSSSTRPRHAQVFTVPVQADDILILASDGLSDNLWDEDVLDEVIRFRQPYIANGAWAQRSESAVKGGFGRSTLAAMLSEALCSRARRASERRVVDSASQAGGSAKEDEVPFARRAHEQGKLFHGGKPDDISVLVAVVSPTELPAGH